MKERKNLAALLKPKAGEGVDAAYETTKKVEASGPSAEENIKDIKKDIRTMSADTKVLVKEAKSTNKTLKSIEKGLTQAKPAATPIEALPSGGAGGPGAGAAAQPKTGDDKKEEKDLGNVSLGAFGGLLGSGAALGAAEVGRSIITANARPGLSQVLDERERTLREGAEMLPSREMFQQDVQRRQAEANQGADYAAATQTLAAAGISPVSPEGPIRPGGRTMQPAEYEQAAQAQAAREAVQRGMRQRTRGGGVSEPRIPPVEQAAQQPESQVEPSETTQISFTEGKFAEADPENYKLFEDFRKQRYKEIKEEEKKKGYDDSTARDLAENKARREAIIKFRKEIEAAGAGAVKTSQQGQAGVQPAAAQPTAEPVQATRAEETTSFDAAKLAEKDPETHARFVARQREIVKEKEAELEKRTDLSPMARNVERQRIQSQAFQTAAKEFTPQAAQAGAATVTRTGSAAGAGAPQVAPQGALTAEGYATSPEAQVEPRETTQISFSEAKFAEADPENYKLFVDFRKQRYNEIKEEEKKKGFSDSISKDIAERKARKEAIIKFRKEIEAAGAGAVKTSQQGQVGVQPSGAQPTSQVTPTPTQGAPSSPTSRESVSGTMSGVIIPREDIDRRAQQLLQNNPYKDDPAAMINAREEAEMELKAERLKTLSAENKDLGRESSQPSTQPVVIQSNNNMSTQTYTPVPAQPRVDSSFTRHQQRNTSF